MGKTMTEKKGRRTSLGFSLGWIKIHNVVKIWTKF